MCHTYFMYLYLVSAADVHHYAANVQLQHTHILTGYWAGESRTPPPPLPHAHSKSPSHLHDWRLALTSMATAPPSSASGGSTGGASASVRGGGASSRRRIHRRCPVGHFLRRQPQRRSPPQIRLQRGSRRNRLARAGAPTSAAGTKPRIHCSLLRSRTLGRVVVVGSTHSRAAGRLRSDAYNKQIQ